MPSPDAQIDTNEALLLKSIDKLDKRIVFLTGQLKVAGNGRLISDTINLNRALKMRSAILREFKVYNDAALSVSDFTPIQKDLTKSLKSVGIKEPFTSVDAKLIKAFSDDTFNELSSLGNQYASQINERIYTGVVAGDSLDEMTLDIKQLLKGGQDRAGRPLLNHAETISTTRYMEVDATLLKKKAEEFNIEKFKYAGSLVKDSRKWCKDHLNDVLTLEEIDKWRDSEWAGKKEGDPFIVRGGWRCRHRWRPLI